MLLRQDPDTRDFPSCWSDKMYVRFMRSSEQSPSQVRGDMRSLTTTLQATRNSLAMKLQHEEKEVSQC